jgi:hypothetical protein
MQARGEQNWGFRSLDMPQGVSTRVAQYVFGGQEGEGTCNTPVLLLNTIHEEKVRRWKFPMIYLGTIAMKSWSMLWSVGVTWSIDGLPN